MKMLFVFIGVMLFSFLFAMSASSQITVTGYDWQEYSQASKISFVQGWIKCGQAALGSLELDMNKLDESIKKSNRQQAVFTEEGVLLGGTTLRQIIESIDRIYQYTVVKNMDIAEIMPFVSGKLTYGWTTAQLEEAIAVTIKLNRCEQANRANDKYMAECASERRQRNTTMKKLMSK